MTDKSNTQAAVYTLEQIADACVEAEISDSKFESLSIALAAQPTPEPLPDHADHVPEIAARLRLVAKLAGCADSVPEDDRTAVGCIFSMLGNIRRALELKPIPEPVAQAATPEDMKVYDGIAQGYFRDAAPSPVALQGRDELPQLPPRSLLSLWAFISDSELAHIGLKARQKIENRVFELMQIYARSALQAARASLPAGGVVEPWGWAIVDKHGTAQAIRPRIKEFFGSIQDQQAFTQEDVKKMDSEWPGLVPHCLVTLYATPQPSETQGRRQMTDEQRREVLVLAGDDADGQEDPDVWGLAIISRTEAFHGIPASPQDGGEKA